jgi:N-acetylglucosamine-6-phosphate deacetylase
MNNAKKAYFGCDVFDGQTRHKKSALLINGERIAGILSEEDVPSDYTTVQLDGGLITPGFVDLQVNGGGGVMFNDEPSVETISTICDAHLPFGTTSLLPTLITDTPDKTTEAIDAIHTAMEAGVGGVVGLHLEGPHLSFARKGAHDPKLIRSMSEKDCNKLILAAGSLSSLLLTVASESVATSQISDLTAAGAVVSLGHTDTGYFNARAAAESGATCVTHLFNAMSQLGNREPGVVGAALNIGQLSAGLIADGFHVDPATIAVALRAKRGPGSIFLVTDAMSTIGTEQMSFTLNGRRIKREGGRLTLSDGTLAGADLDMISAVRFMVEKVGLDVEEAVRMATLYPAQVLNRENEFGQLIEGSQADFLLLNTQLDVDAVWRAGSQT